MSSHLLPHLLPRPLLRAAVFMVLCLGMALPATAGVSPAQPAPDFTLRNLAGGNLRLAEQRGQVVMVNFWATWCGPCRVELPHLERLYTRYRSAGFVLLGVNVDDQAAAGLQMAQRMGLSFPVLHDADKAVTRRYDVGAMPGTVLIDRDGTVRHLHRGYRDGMERQYEEQIRALLKE
jgi:peroxiredoxin